MYARRRPIDHFRAFFFDPYSFGFGTAHPLSPMSPPDLLRPRRRRRAGLWISLGLSFSGAAVAQAPEAAVPLHLELSGPADCSDRADLIARIRRRTDGIRFVEQPGDVRSIQIQIQTLPDALSARFTLSKPGGAPSVRRLRARDCDEVLDALALITAVTIVPRSALQAPIERAPPEPAGTPSRPAEDRAAAQAAPAAKPEPTPTPAFWFAPHVAGEVVLGPAPDPLPGIALGASAGLHLGQGWSPAVRLSVGRAERGDFEQPGGRATFRLDSATLEACPLWFGSWPVGVGLRACALAAAGRLHASGADTDNPRSVARPWWLLGGSLVVQLYPTSAWEISARVAGGFPLLRDQFQFRPEIFHEVPLVTGRVGLWIGYRFR